MMGERGWKGGVFNPPPQLFSAGVAVLAALSRLTSRCFKFIYLFGDNLFGVRGIIKGRNTLFSIATGGIGHELIRWRLISCAGIIFARMGDKSCLICGKIAQRVGL